MFGRKWGCLLLKCLQLRVSGGKVSSGELSVPGSVCSKVLTSFLATYKWRDCMCTVLVRGEGMEEDT